MKFAKIPVSQNPHDLDHTSGQSVSETQQSEDSTMSLVYPDGRVTSVKVRQRK